MEMYNWMWYVFCFSSSPYMDDGLFFFILVFISIWVRVHILVRKITIFIMNLSFIVCIMNLNEPTTTTIWEKRTYIQRKARGYFKEEMVLFLWILCLALVFGVEEKKMVFFCFNEFLLLCGLEKREEKKNEMEKFCWIKLFFSVLVFNLAIRMFLDGFIFF